MAKRKDVPVKTKAPKTYSSSFVSVLPVVFALALAALVAVPSVRANGVLVGSFVAAAVALVGWWAVLQRRVAGSGRPYSIEVSLRPQHYLQALAHTSILVYWGVYWEPLRDAAVLIVAQLLFAYAFDMLLSWSRRGAYTLGFGPFPVVYSTNLFLRFRDDWFYLQFAMVAVGFLAKELIRWTRDGRRTHIFNPSSFPLALFSLGLILTHTTHLTWGEDIASKLILPPHIYLFIFAVSLPGQLLFRVTTMTLPAVLTTYGLSMLYLKMTGTYFFWDSNVPIAVFLGMNLLFTDPSTAPRTELGRIIFGAIYGATVVGLYALLDWFGAPTFYDKLLQVPLMNLSVRALDRAALSRALRWLSPERIGASLAPIRRSAAIVGIWIIVFASLSFTKGVGDYHEGLTIPFWQQACDARREDACRKLGAMLNGHCVDGSGWACNELALLVTSGQLNAAVDPAALFEKSCGLGFKTACDNRTSAQSGSRNFKHGDAGLDDFVRVLRQGKGSIPETTQFAVFTRACDEGWMSGCDHLSELYLRGGSEGGVDRARAASLAGKACDGGVARSCMNVGLMFRAGEVLPKDAARSAQYLKRACDLGHAPACELLGGTRDK